MKFDRKSFGMKLWLYFAVFAAIILGSLWLLQTVFLQYFYDVMVIGNIQKAVSQIAEKNENTDMNSHIDSLARANSLLIFLTDRQGNVLHSADEHSAAYEEKNGRSGGDGDNPYVSPGERLNWQIGATRNLPPNYASFLQKLLNSPDGQVGYAISGNSAGVATYVYGRILPESDAVLYASAPLGAAGAAVGILCMQLAWVTAASLALGFMIAFFISRRFARPVSAISKQAGRMADGDFSDAFGKGFCSEIDELSDTLNRTAAGLARAENIRRDFLANVSHDLRTPLTMIKGYAEMVKDMSWEDGEKREADLDVIIRESDRLTGLVNELLEYSALQSDVRSFEFENMDISAAVHEVVERFKPLCERGGYRMAAQIAQGQFVGGDRNRLARVLYNLVGNAIDHSGERREIQVALKNLGTAVRVEIRDSGKGIARDELPGVWERYFTSGQRKSDGVISGLGLAIAKEILTAHSAAFGVDSDLGQGSTFWFEMGKRLS